MKTKYIHYCWFGKKPLPKLAKKCIKSWKKYLPDYEIIRWDETNVNINECPFIKGAYENKKWAFVADYARTKAIYEMGGIYFDTDMLVTKEIDFLLDKETFLGVEDSMMVATGVWGASKAKTYFSKNILDFYKSQENFDINNMFKYSIPRIMTKVLNKYGYDHTKNEIQELEHNITIYPRDYFYPLSFDFKNNLFTDNTCMIHYYDASWFNKKAKLKVKLNRLIGEKNVDKLKNIIKRIFLIIKKILLKILYKPSKYIYYTYFNKGKYKQDIEQGINELKKIKRDFIVMHNPDWLGITSATIELFDNNRVPCGEFFTKRDIKKFGDLIIKQEITQVIFSAMCLGWKELAYYIKKKNPKIKIKAFFHGSLSQVLEPYGWERNKELIDMCKDGTIEVFGTCKKSLVKFYENLGIKTHFIMNNVTLNEKIKSEKHENTVLGLYAAKKDDWRKNLFAQIAGASLIKNATIDIIPMDYEAKTFAQSLGLKVTGVDKALPRKELLKRMSQNTLNLYVTFSECAPMLPIESFEVGTICLTGNNHHYFKNTELEKYLVVDNEESPIKIAEKIKLCISNQEKIMKIYKTWKNENDKNSRKSVEDFLEM